MESIKITYYVTVGPFGPIQVRKLCGMNAFSLAFISQMFEIKGKVALVTGGAAGIGLEASKHILRAGARGLTIADLDPKAGKIALDELRSEFGQERVIFVSTDVTDKDSFENAFKQTLSTFNNVDILVNNAGIYNEKDYVQEINVNLIGVTHGLLLGFDKYIANHKTGSEGVIINTASILAVKLYHTAPIYSATKSAVAVLTMGYGNKVHYERTGVKVVAVAPGFSKTAILGNVRNSRDDVFGELLTNTILNCKLQTVDYVARSIVKIIQEKPSGTVWVSEDEQEAVEYVNPYEG